jgi:hypothetical protein
MGENHAYGINCKNRKSTVRGQQNRRAGGQINAPLRRK